MRSRAWVSLIVLLLAAVLIAGVVRSAGRVRSDGATVLHPSISSSRVRGRMPLTLVAPAGGGEGRPLLVFLHGRGEDQNSQLTDEFFSALRSLGPRAPDVAFPYGGDHSYWHNRSDGQWMSYVVDDVIPTAARALHADRRRIAIGGISMGGFGAHDIARFVPGRLCAVGGHSAAIWRSADLTAPGAFDDRGDFVRNDVIAWAAAHHDPYGRARLWLDGGDQDPFHQADEGLAQELGIRMHVWPGSHNTDYWNAHWRDYLGFYANALSDCP